MSGLPFPHVTVFISSTIGECAAEREAACKAIESIKCEPVIFEQIGARPHPARITYLEGLARSQICVIIWKESYGWIDPALTISGIEDEFRIAQTRQLDILLYIKMEAPKRDERLAALIKEAQTFITTYSYENAGDLQDQISSDVTSLLSRAYIDRTTQRADRLIDPAAVLLGTLPTGMLVVSRPAIEKKIDESIQLNALTWVTGPAGAGKTILLAQWSNKKTNAYVNGRGLSFRHLVYSISIALSKSSSFAEPISVDDALSNLRSVWIKDAKWPLVIDDPVSAADVLRLFEDMGDAEGCARIVVGTRAPPQSIPHIEILVPGLTSLEAAEMISSLPQKIQTGVTAMTIAAGQFLPLTIRKAIAQQSTPEYLVFDDVPGISSDPKTRELLALIVSSPEPLTLEDLSALAPSDDGIVVLDGQLKTLSILLVDDGLGFRPVHDEIAHELHESLSKRPALRKLVSLRLAKFFSKSKRYMSAFKLYRDLDAPQAIKVAYRAAQQASMEGRFALAIEPMEFIIAVERKAGERANLVISLLALAQAQQIMGNSPASLKLFDEAEQIAKELKDDILLQSINDQKLLFKIHQDLEPADLNALREIRTRYKKEKRVAESARLASEEGAILISVGDHHKAVEVLREARTDFQKLEDDYGVYIATRNLIAALNMCDDAAHEAEDLLKSLRLGRSNEIRSRERAWMCNILTRRYRLDGRLEESISTANEAIEIGLKLEDTYVVALNRIGLGNALREKGDLDAALEAFKQSGKEAQTIHRKEIDGLASRLASEVLLEKVEIVAPYLHPALYGEAEVFATHVVGLLNGSISEYQAAAALDNRGEARWGLGRKTEALEDWAASVKMFLRLEQERAIRLLRNLAANLNLDNPREAVRIMMAALPETKIEPNEGPWTQLIKLIRGSILHGHARASAIYVFVALKITQKIVSKQLEFGLWLRLLSLALKDCDPPDDGRMSFALIAFLAHTRRRDLKIHELTAITELIVGKSKAVHFHAVDTHLQTSMTLGQNNEVMIVLDDIDGTPATRFLSVALTCFFTAFRNEIDTEFLSAPLTDGLYIRCALVDLAMAPKDIQESLATSPRPVSIVTFDDAKRPTDLFMVCRSDLQTLCQGDTMKGTELQFMYADVLRSLLALALGDSIEPEMLRPKIVSIIRKTIF